MGSRLPELPRAHLSFGPFGTIEDDRDGNLYREMRGEVYDVRESSALAWYADQAGDAVFLERPSGAKTVVEREERRRRRAERAATPARVRAGERVAP